MMMTQYPWAVGLRIPKETIASWQMQAGNSDLLRWALANGKLPEFGYQEWAKAYYQLPSLDAKFFEQSPNPDLWAKWGSFSWSGTFLPIYEWEGTLYIACLEPPNFEQSKVVESLGVRVGLLIAPMSGMKKWWHILAPATQAMGAKQNLPPELAAFTGGGAHTPQPVNNYNPQTAPVQQSVAPVQPVHHQPAPQQQTNVASPNLYQHQVPVNQMPVTPSVPEPSVYQNQHMPSEPLREPSQGQVATGVAPATRVAHPFEQEFSQTSTNIASLDVETGVGLKQQGGHQVHPGINPEFNNPVSVPSRQETEAVVRSVPVEDHTPTNGPVAAPVTTEAPTNMRPPVTEATNTNVQIPTDIPQAPPAPPVAQRQKLEEPIEIPTGDWLENTNVMPTPPNFSAPAGGEGSSHMEIDPDEFTGIKNLEEVDFPVEVPPSREAGKTATMTDTKELPTKSNIEASSLETPNFELEEPDTAVFDLDENLSLAENGAPEVSLDETQMGEGLEGVDLGALESKDDETETAFGGLEINMDSSEELQMEGLSLGDSSESEENAFSGLEGLEGLDLEAEDSPEENAFSQMLKEDDDLNQGLELRQEKPPSPHLVPDEEPVMPSFNVESNGNETLKVSHPEKETPEQAIVTPITEGTKKEKAKNHEEQLAYECLDEMSRYFDRCMIFELHQMMLKPLVWKGNWHVNSNLNQNIDLSMSSIFRVVFTSKKPYHGYVVRNSVNDAFLNAFNQGELPDHATLVPVLIDNNLVAIVLGFTDQHSAERVKLEDCEVAADRYSKKLLEHNKKMSGAA